MGIGISNIANALAIMAGGAGKGMLEVALKNRDEYHQQMRDERISAARKVETEEERAFSKEMKTEDRGFQREMSREDREWDKEKFAQQQTHAEKMARLTASLRPKEKGPQASESERMISKIAEINARKEGRAKANDDDYMSAFKEYKASGRAGNDGIERVYTATDGTVYGIKDSGEKVDIGIKGNPPGGKSDNKVTAPQYMSMYQKEIQTIRKNPQYMMGKDEEVAKLARSSLDARLDEMNADYPGRGAKAELESKGTGVSGSWDDAGGARPASESEQESVSEVAQPGVVEAPATDTSGDEPKPGVPRGEGSARSPYLAETEEEVKWALEHGSPGDVIQYKDQIWKIPVKNK